MKKAQKDRMKDGDKARRRYEEFMQSPWWRREQWSDKDRDNLIAFLQQTYDDELELVDLLLDGHQNLIAKDQRNHINRPELLDEATTRVLRLNSVRHLITILKDRRNLRSADLSMYCRDN